MKTAVIYFSLSGNTAKVARAIAEALPGQVDLAELREAPPLDDYDLVFLGMPMHQFGAPERVRAYLQGCCTGRRIALFVTHAAPEDMPELQPWLDACRQAADGADVVAVFNCQGQVPPATRQSWIDTGVPMLVQFGQMAVMADGQPDEAALERAQTFAREAAASIDALAVG